MAPAFRCQRGQRGSERVSLADRAIIITGAASGIGRATGVLAASRAASCFLSDMEPDRVAAVADGIGAKSGWACAFACDVTSREQIEPFVEEVLAAAGRIDVLVDSARLIRAREGRPMPELVRRSSSGIRL